VFTGAGAGARVDGGLVGVVPPELAEGAVEDGTEVGGGEGAADGLTGLAPPAVGALLVEWPGSDVATTADSPPAKASAPPTSHRVNRETRFSP